jgi:ribose transport system permease protein
VIYGRLQPIVTTIATGSVFYGAALALRRVPGGDVDSTLADALTGQLPGGMPASLVLLAALVVIVWMPFRRSALGRAAYAVGSSEVAAYMSGVPIRRAKFAAYVLSGLLASAAGLFLTCVTYSGEASAANGGSYTLYSIAAVGARGRFAVRRLRQRNRRDLWRAHVPDDRRSALRVQCRAAAGNRCSRGAVLVAAVCLGSLRLLRIRNRLDLYG